MRVLAQKTSSYRLPFSQRISASVATIFPVVMLASIFADDVGNNSFDKSLPRSDRPMPRNHAVCYRRHDSFCSWNGSPGSWLTSRNTSLEKRRWARCPPATCVCRSPIDVWIGKRKRWQYSDRGVLTRHRSHSSLPSPLAHCDEVRNFGNTLTQGGVTCSQST